MPIKRAKTAIYYRFDPCFPVYGYDLGTFFEIGHYYYCAINLRWGDN